MMERFLPTALVVILFSITFAGKESVQDTGVLAMKSRNFVNLLVQGKFEDAVKNFNGKLRKALPPEKLKQAWETLTTQVGGVIKCMGMREEKAGNYEIYYVTCKFEKANIDVKIVFDREGKIAGLFFVPSTSTTEYTPPSYAKKGNFKEVEVKIGKGEWSLPGVLTIPEGEGPFPAVILVHGSGPHDRDETIGPNKPFRDIAWGLASRGIAVLRYDKRTKVYPERMKALEDSITVRKEVIEDVIAAFSFLRERKEINPERIFVLGHSLGGMLLPWIAKEEPRIAGLIIMAGPARPLEDLIYEQTAYIFSLDGKISPEEKRNLEELKKQVERVKSPELTLNTPAEELPLGIPASYWLSLRGYDPVEVAKTLNKPILVLQGGRDYQVTVEDFERWKEALSGKENVQFKLYPDLNHLFMKGKGKSTPAEYEIKGHVTKEVIEDIAKWLKEI